MRSSFHALVAATLTVAAGGILSAQGAPSPAPGARRIAVAVPRAAPIRVDGRLDDEEWKSATPAGGFVQRTPNERAPATERTEVRVAFDEEAIYVGARVHDRRPDSVAANIGPRDDSGPSDEFFVQFDSYNDRRSAFVFSISAGGTKSDLRITGGSNVDMSWNAVWDGAVSRDSLGWSAEYRIPFSQLRFAGAPGEEMRWGVNFIRWIARHAEDAQWSLIPQGAASWVEHYGELRGLRAPPTRGGIEVQPYVVNSMAFDGAAKGTRAAGAGLRDARQSSVSFGGDARYSITPAFTLSAAIRPDFGQVEADPSVVNLTSLETFLPEKRPLFLEGAELLRFSTAEWFDEGEVFYSRRVGRSPQGSVPGGATAEGATSPAPVLAALKLAGKSASGVSLALFSGITGAVDRECLSADALVRRAVVEPRSSYSAGRLRKEMGEGASEVGVSSTFVKRDLDGDASALAPMLRNSALVAGVDGLHRFGPARGYTLQGWALASVVQGSAEAIAATQRSGVHLLQRPDASALPLDTTLTSLRGWAAGASAAKTAGNLRLRVTERAFSPGHEPNDLGYLARADRIVHHAHVGYEQRRPGNRSRSWFSFLNQVAEADFSGRRVFLQHFLNTEVQFPSYWTLFTNITYTSAGRDTDALQGGPALRTDPTAGAFLQLTTDRREPFSAGWSGLARRREDGGSHLRTGLDMRVRPSQRLLLTAFPSVERNTINSQYVGVATPVPGRASLASRYVVARIRQETASLTSRMTLVLTPSLEIQGYAQPFLSAGRYDRYAVVRDGRAESFTDRFAMAGWVRRANSNAIELDAKNDMTPDATITRPDFTRRDFNATMTLRWEYRSGSVLHLVWNRQRDAGDDSGSLAPGNDAGRVMRVPGMDVVAVKLAYWFGR